MIEANAHPATVLRPIVDAVGNRLAQALVHKGRPPHGLGHALGLIFTPTVGKVPDPLFVLGIDRDYQLAALLKILDLGVDPTLSRCKT